MQQRQAPVRRWRAPEPRRLPALRGVVQHWLRTEGPGYYHGAIRTGTQQMGVDPATAPGDNARMLALAERHRVTGGLTWVDPAMTRLAQHAGRHLPRYDLFPHHLPSPHGLMVFADPLASLWSDGGIPVEIVAASWGPWSGPAAFPWPAGGAWMTFYSSHAGRRYRGGTRHVADQLGLSDVDPLLPYHEAGWPFAELPAIELPAGTTAEWARTLIAAWLLMRQPLHTETTPGPALPASAKNRMRRAGLPTGRVQIVRVRRREHDSSGRHREGGYTWGHQAKVPGFWRRYHVGPGRARVEWMWIDDYVAGPPDAPLREAEQVRVWDR